MRVQPLENHHGHHGVCLGRPFWDPPIWWFSRVISNRSNFAFEASNDWDHSDPFWSILRWNQLPHEAASKPTCLIVRWAMQDLGSYVQVSHIDFPVINGIISLQVAKALCVSQWLLAWLSSRRARILDLKKLPKLGFSTGKVLGCFGCFGYFWWRRICIPVWDTWIPNLVPCPLPHVFRSDVSLPGSRSAGSL